MLLILMVLPFPLLDPENRKGILIITLLYVSFPRPKRFFCKDTMYAPNYRDTPGGISYHHDPTTRRSSQAICIFMTGKRAIIQFITFAIILKKCRIPGGKLNKKNLPFQNMTQQGWQNLALASVFLFYVLQIGFDLISRNMCGNLAVDYCAYWSAGRVIHENGYPNIYDLNLLTQIQKTIYPQGNDPSSSFSGIPVPHLPIFFIPFQILSFLSLRSSFWVWTLLNVTGFILYLRFFTKEVTGYSLPFRLLIMIFLSLPVFLNLFLGQVNIWLGICAGEFMRAILLDKPFRAGLWLGGWLLKPQLLVLIIPVLFIRSSIKALAGFTVSSAVVLGISYYLVNIKGFINLANLLFGFAKGTANNNPEIMMNWRMLGLHISGIFSPIIGWGVIVIGTMLTVYAAMIISRKPAGSDFTKPVIGFLGIFAATGAVTWHAHLSMSIIMIPPMIYLYVKKRFPENLFIFWVFMPTVIMLIIYILAAFMKAGVVHMDIAEFLDLLAGLRGLLLNIIILVWAIIEYPKTLLPKESFALNSDV